LEKAQLTSEDFENDLAEEKMKVKQSGRELEVATKNLASARKSEDHLQ